MPIDLSASSVARRISTRSGRDSSGDHDSESWLNGAFSFRPRLDLPASLLDGFGVCRRPRHDQAGEVRVVGRQVQAGDQPDSLVGRRLPLIGRRGVVGDAGHEAAHATAARVDAHDHASLLATASRAALTAAARSVSRPA